MRWFRRILSAIPFLFWQQDGVPGVGASPSTWFFCRRQQDGKEPCPAQCQVCAEDQDRMRVRAEGQVPQ